MVQFAKTNFLLSGWICIVLGASISIAVPDVIGLTISFPLGIAGIMLLITGIRRDPEERVNIDEMRSWQFSRRNDVLLVALFTMSLW